MRDDFWNDISSSFRSAGMDEHLGDCGLEGAHFTSMQQLTDAGRALAGLKLSVDAGTRVRFLSNVGSILTYDSVPGKGIDGTVITVKTGTGNTTNLDGRVFVLWDDGKCRGILAEHLRPASVASKRASVYRMVVADLGDLTAFFSKSASGESNELVHKSTQDLWAFHQDNDQFVIERLFDETGEPLRD